MYYKKIIIIKGMLKMKKKEKGTTSLMSRFAIVLWNKSLSSNSVIAAEFKKTVTNKLSNSEYGSTLFIAYAPGTARLELARVIHKNAVASYKVMDVLKKLQKGSEKDPWANIKKTARKTDILVYVVSDPEVFKSVMDWFLNVYLKCISDNPELPESGPYMVVVDPRIDGKNRVITGMKKVELITF